jgi:hypothetical protein
LTKLIPQGNCEQKNFFYNWVHINDNLFNYHHTWKMLLKLNKTRHLLHGNCVHKNEKKNWLPSKSTHLQNVCGSSYLGVVEF